MNGIIKMKGFICRLNFFITNQDKIDMFVLGAKAATEFLLQFDWAAYKDDRTIMQIKLNTEPKPAAQVTPA